LPDGAGVVSGVEGLLGFEGVLDALWLATRVTRTRPPFGNGSPGQVARSLAIASCSAWVTHAW